MGCLAGHLELIRHKNKRDTHIWSTVKDKPCNVNNPSSSQEHKINSCISTKKKKNIYIWNRYSVSAWLWIFHFNFFNPLTDGIKLVDALFHTTKIQRHNVQVPAANRNYTACAENSEPGMTQAPHFSVLKWCTEAYLWKIYNSRQVNCCVEHKIKRWRPCENFCSLWETVMTETNWRSCKSNGVYRQMTNIPAHYIYMLFVRHQLQTWRLCETSRLRLDTPNLTYVYYKICTWALGFRLNNNNKTSRFIRL